jgi:hypothetical protein
MDADTSQADGTPAIVWRDPDNNNNFPTIWVYQAATTTWLPGFNQITQLITQMNNLLPNAGYVLTPVSVSDVEGIPILHALTDAAGASYLYGRKDGGVFISGRIHNIVTDHAEYVHMELTKDFKLIRGVSKLGGNIFGRTEIVEVPGPAGIVFTDKNFRAYARDPGYPDVNIPVIGGTGSTVSQPVVLPYAATDYEGIASNGQSLAIGALSNPLLSTVQPYGNVMLSGGLRSDTATTDISFTPLIEQNYTPPGSDYEQGETPVSGCLNGLVDRIAIEDGLAYPNQNTVFVGSAVGLGGTAIQALDKPSATYQKLLDHIAASYRIANAQSKSYSFFADIWIQGESDYRDNTARSVYLSIFTNYKNDVISDAQSITKQAYPPFFLVNQTQAHRYYARAYPAIALALWDAANADNSEVRIATPNYIFDYVNFAGDVLHLTNKSSKWLGWYFTRLLKRLRDDRIAGRPPGKHRVDIERATWQGRVIDITYHLPPAPPNATETPTLEWDTAWVSAAPNMGFGLYNEDNSLVAGGILTVNIIGTNRVQIILAADPAPGQKLTYGWGDPVSTGQVTGRVTGPRGNLRDNMGDNASEKLDFGGGDVRSGHNWAVVHEILQPGA